MRNILKKSLFFTIGCLLASVVWAVEPTLSINESSQGSTSYLKAYTTEGITLSSSASFSSGAVQLGNTPSSYDQHYIEVLAANNTIDSVSFLISGNGSNKSIQAPVFGWAQTATSNTADTYRILDVVTVTANSYSAAKWFTYKFNGSNVKCVRIYRSTKNISSVTPAYTGTSTALGSGQTIKVYGLKIWLAGGSTPTVVDVTGVSLNKTTTSIQVGASEQLTATIEPNNATNKAVNWSSNPTSVATVDNSGNVTAVAEGTATITVTTQDGNKTATCTVTVTPASSDPVAVTGVSLNKTSTTLTVGGSETLTASVQPSNATNKAVNWSSNPTSVATVDSNGKVTAVAEGTATITVTTQDGNKTATCTVTVNAAPPTPPTPPTTLTLHLPEVYEAPTAAGGYGGTLKEFNGREYEVYYAGKTSDSKMTVDIRPSKKVAGIAINNTSTSCEAPDGWFTAATTNISDYSNTDMEEFVAGSGSVHKMQGCRYKMHVKGYDTFSILAADKNVDKKDGAFKKEQRFRIFIDNVMQLEDQASTSVTVRRYPITTGEHLIEVEALNGGASLFYGFSLRVAQEPRVKYLDGNDSTQVVYQGASPEPVLYYTKYNKIPGAQTVLEWDGAAANGITLSPAGSDALGDTLAISGTANCQCGVYHYNVVSKYNGNPTRTIPGTLHVATSLRPSSRDSVFEAFKGEEIDEIAFTYMALSEDSVKLTWKTAAPAGITGHGVSGTKKYVISGTPSVTGDYEFTVSIGGGETVFKGLLKITEVDFGNNPVMYLYKNSLAYENDGVYQYLKSSEGGSVNLIPRKAKESGAREPYNYSSYKWVLISEDVDADNAEILAIVRNNASNLPVLNMKSFSYAEGRLGWGEPNNGSIDSTTNNGCNIYVEQPTHPIFKDITATGGKIQVLNKVSKRGVMPIDINNCPGSFCLATAYTRNIEDYYTDGEKQTIIHEIPVGLNGRTKNYICFPLANTKDNLTSNGKKLLRNIVNYLLGTTHFSGLPELKMTGFSVAGYTASINQEENLIELNLTLDQFDAADSLRAVKPVITLADGKTHVIPDADEELDLRYTTFLPKTFVVTDYINRRAYSFFVNITRPEGIDEVYEVGQWVNVFDIYGRKIATTNEDIYTMDLPRGMYIIVTEKGQSIKLMK